MRSSLPALRVQTDSQGFLEDDRRPGHSIGDRVSIQPLGLQNPKLERRGLTMEFTAGGCPSTHGNRTLSLTFICDPHAGTYSGMPGRTLLYSTYVVLEGSTA